MNQNQNPNQGGRSRTLQQPGQQGGQQGGQRQKPGQQNQQPDQGGRRTRAANAATTRRSNAKSARNPGHAAEVLRA